MTSKQSTLRLALPDDLRAWIEQQADDIGCDAATWIRMQLVAARKGANGAVVPLATFTRDIGLPHPEPRQAEEDAWRGPIEDEPSSAPPEAIAALVERTLSHSESSEPSAASLPPMEMFAKSPDAAAAPNGATRALSIPPRRYAGTNNPPGL
jgi:hypothetical protein